MKAISSGLTKQEKVPSLFRRRTVSPHRHSQAALREWLLLVVVFAIYAVLYMFIIYMAEKDPRWFPVLVILLLCAATFYDWLTH
jgi:membrane protein YdbS with pleckstrin-like domain